MYKHLLILPDGAELFSGDTQTDALQSVKLTYAVNNGEELTLGSACSASLEATVLLSENTTRLEAGIPIQVYAVDDARQRTLLGVYYLETPARPARNLLELTAQDSVSLLDKDLTQWLSALEAWPYTALEFARMVCDACGVELVNDALPNGDFYIRAFSAEFVTGRHLIQWLGQMTGRFCRATPEGKLEFAWYAPNEAATLTPNEAENSLFYYEGGLSAADYRVQPIQKIQIRQSSQDVGTVWPDEEGRKNTYILENNPLLAAQDSETLLPVAQALYEQLREFTYTPCRVEIPAAPGIQAGDILTLTDPEGSSLCVCVMRKTSDGQRDTLECTGSRTRDSSYAVNNLGFQSHSGKLLHLRADVDGLLAENRDTQGRLASIGLDLEGITGTVQRQDTALQGMAGTVSTLSQQASSLSLEITEIRENGTDKVKTSVGYTFDDKGLRIHRTDSDMENLLDHTGMHVNRYGQTLLQADHQGVKARDVTVENYLIVGDYTRFEDYAGGRTACYYIG